MGRFMQVVLKQCVCAGKFLDNLIQGVNHLRWLCWGLRYSFPVVEAEPRKLKANDFMPGFPGLDLSVRAWKHGVP
jgi:hypothetical protein